MNTVKYLAGAAALAVATMATPAMAQDAGQAEPFIGAQIGYHDFDSNPLGDDDGLIYGLYGGVDVPVSDTIFLGLEGNFNLGTAAIDSEYGIAGRVGFYAGENTKIFLRGGYQEVNFDADNLVSDVIDDPDFTFDDDLVDDTDGDYLLGVGAEFGLNENLSLRAGIDTIAFDTLRLTTGIQLNF